MKLPSTVKIGAYTYKVIRQNKVMYKGEELDGLCDNINMKIFVAKGLDKTRLKIVFMHECLHSLAHVNKVHLSEKEVDILDSAIVQFLQDNKLSFM